MQWYGAQAKKPPHDHLLRNILEVSHTWHTNIEPLLLRMSLIDLFARRRRENLHAVIATAEEHRAHSIDTQMDPRVDPFRFVAVTSIDLSDPLVELEYPQGPN